MKQTNLRSVIKWRKKSTE